MSWKIGIFSRPRAHVPHSPVGLSCGAPGFRCPAFERPQVEGVRVASDRRNVGAGVQRAESEDELVVDSVQLFLRPLDDRPASAVELRPKRRAESHSASYRELLEACLGERLPGDVWTRLVQVGVFCGALMLLLEKARQLEADPTPKANAEWQWWVDALTSLC